MRIAVYKDSLSTGRGADRAVRNFAAGITERGHDTTLFEKDELALRLAEHWDAIIATGSNEAVDLDAAGYFSRSDRAKVVLQLHLAPRGFFKWKHPLRNRRIRRAFDKADAVQLLCQGYVAEFRRLAPHPRLFVIGNYTELPPPQTPPPEPPPVILYPAAVVNRVKNQKLLIEAFARLADEFPAWRVRLLGKDSTSYAADCRRLVEKLGVAERIEFVGFTRDLAAVYGNAAFVAFPSTLEGFPLALLEAAQFGLCAVAHRALPGVSDILCDGKTGLITEPTPAAYAAGLRQLMANPGLRRHMGEHARTFCAERYSRKRILDAWEALLDEVVSDKTDNRPKENGTCR